MKIIQKLIDSSKYNIKSPYKITPTRIVVHNTANDASALNEISYMSTNDKQVSFHYAVDDKMVVQGLPETRNSWNAGGGNGKGNREGISIEICYSKSGGEKFEKSEKNAAIFISSLLKKYNWNIENVTKHEDYGHRNCPHRTLSLGWDRFLNMIKNELDENVNLEPIDKIVNEVIKGNWGNGSQRKENLTKAGYNYKELQDKVNKKLKN
ncbi:MAG: N-acetylmuramoyl-L-alanine amidase [Bacilli bacterium]